MPLISLACTRELPPSFVYTRELVLNTAMPYMIRHFVVTLVRPQFGAQRYTGTHPPRNPNVEVPEAGLTPSMIAGGAVIYDSSTRPLFQSERQRPAEREPAVMDNW